MRTFEVALLLLQQGWLVVDAGGGRALAVRLSDREARLARSLVEDRLAEVAARVMGQRLRRGGRAAAG